MLDEETDNNIKRCIDDIVMYFRNHGFDDSNIDSGSTLTVFSVLPPEIRIRVLESIVEENHNPIVLEKLSKAYAKNGQLELLENRIKEWLELGYTDKIYADNLIESAKVLFKYRDSLPIASSLEKAKENFENVCKQTKAPKDFLVIMRRLLYT